MFISAYALSWRSTSSLAGPSLSSLASGGLRGARRASAHRASAHARACEARAPRGRLLRVLAAWLSAAQRPLRQLRRGRGRPAARCRGRGACVWHRRYRGAETWSGSVSASAHTSASADALQKRTADQPLRPRARLHAGCRVPVPRLRAHARRQRRGRATAHGALRRCRCRTSSPVCSRFTARRSSSVAACKEAAQAHAARPRQPARAVRTLAHAACGRVPLRLRRRARNASPCRRAAAAHVPRLAPPRLAPRRAARARARSKRAQTALAAQRRVRSPADCARRHRTPLHRRNAAARGRASAAGLKEGWDV